MKRILYILFLLLPLSAFAQVKERIVNPVIDYQRTPQKYYIGDIAVEGVKNYEDFVLIGLSGLQKGQRITVPGEEITRATQRYWKHGLFSNVSIKADSIVGDSIYLRIVLASRPHISQINYFGVKKSEREDLESKLGLVKDMQLLPTSLQTARIWGKRYFDDKGYKNAEIEFVQHDDVSEPGKVIIDVNVDKKDKVKVNSINVLGNDVLPLKKIKGTLFRNGAFKKTHERGKISSWFRSKKFVDKKWTEDKERLIEKYNELGFRDARIVYDSVSPHDESSVDIVIRVEEGQNGWATPSTPPPTSMRNYA